MNNNRTREAVATGDGDRLRVGLPFCRVMISDGVETGLQQDGAAEGVEVLDVAQLLLRSVKGETPASVG